ncbi:hypothetical protein ACOMHN_019761 [Nucella lapillus]
MQMSCTMEKKGTNYVGFTFSRDSTIEFSLGETRTGTKGKSVEINTSQFADEASENDDMVFVALAFATVCDEEHGTVCGKLTAVTDFYELYAASEDEPFGTTVCSYESQPSDLHASHEPFLEMQFDPSTQIYITGLDEGCISDCSDCRKSSVLEYPVSRIPELENYLALDCEMVWMEVDPDAPKDRQIPQIKGNKELALGRVSIVDHSGEVVLDTFVSPPRRVVDYATQFSGLREDDLAKGRPLHQVQELVASIIWDKVLVVHDPRNDLYVLGLSHPEGQIRDTSNNPELTEMTGKFKYHQRIKLQQLAAIFLDRTIQTGEHCSVVDARATMDIFVMFRLLWVKLSHLK